MKACSKCKLEKSEEDFYLRGDNGRRHGACKECLRAQQKAHYTENKDKISAQQKVYREGNRERAAAYNKIYRVENRKEIAAQRKVYREENRENILARKPDQSRFYKYGVTPDDFKRMLIKQGGVCAICGGPKGKMGFCVDHDHLTKKVRGLLCTSCNVALGGFKDSVPILKSAISYLTAL